MSAVNPLVRRQAALDATLARFAGQPFAWGRNDCARMAAHLLRGLGHRPTLAKAGSYSSALGAAKALKRAGHDSLEAALDGQGLTRIPPAAALPGDLLGLPGADERWPLALTLAVGNGRVFGFLNGVGAVMQPSDAPILAWRTL